MSEIKKEFELAEYEKDLMNHDWYYNYTDDMNAFREGSKESQRLLRMSNNSPEHKLLYDKVKALKMK